MNATPGIEIGKSEIDEWLARATTDTGFVARELLGFNYDYDERTNRKTNIGSGGIRDADPYRKMAAFVADPNIKLGMLLAARGSYKSSVFVADAHRHLIDRPEDALLYMSGSDKQVFAKSRAIRNSFERSPFIKAIWGSAKPHERSGKPWKIDEWTLSARKDVHRDAASFTARSLKHPPVGGHYNKIYLDDLIDLRNCRNADQLELARQCLQLIMPLRTPGAPVRVAGTLYNPADIYSFLMGLESWQKMILKPGFDLEELSDGNFRVIQTQPEPTFPHLTLEYVREQFETMQPDEFCSQYLMRYMSGVRQVFKREWFQTVPMSVAQQAGLTLWLCTDLALSTAHTACMSVAILVGMDQQRRIFLLDAFIGRVETGQFVEEIFGLASKWIGRHGFTFGGMLGERVTIGTVLMSWLRTEEMKRGIRLNIREIPRQGAVQRKDERIERLQPKMRAGDFYVVDCFPRHYRTGGKQFLLWDPIGHHDGDKRLPDGKLVEQFVYHPEQGENNKDIADSLSDLEHVYPNGEPAAYWQPPQRTWTQRRDPRLLDKGGDPAADWLASLGKAPT